MPQKEKKKILIISKYLPTKKEGMECRLASLIPLFKKKYHVRCIRSDTYGNFKKYKNIYNYENKIGVRFITIKTYKFNKRFFSIYRIFSWLDFEYKLFKLKDKFKPNIVYISSLSLLTIIYGVYLKKKFNAKLIFEMRDLIPYTFYYTNKFSKFNPMIIFLGLIEKIGIKNSNLIVGLVPRIKDYIKFRGFMNKKVISSSFPVNIKYFKHYKNTKIDKFFNVCYAGNFGFDNYVSDLLELISKLKKIDNIIFHFIGDGSLKNSLAKKYKNYSNIKFHNHINSIRLHKKLSKMDLLLVSFNLETKLKNFGYELNKLNNYMMAAKPILILGKKNNLSKKRGNFVFVNSKNKIRQIIVFFVLNIL